VIQGVAQHTANMNAIGAWVWALSYKSVG